MTGERFEFVAANERRVAGRLAGSPSAPALFLAHPIGFDGRFWEATAAALSDRYFLIAADARGHGRSGRGEGEASLRMLADDVLFILDRLDIRHCGFAGCSMGSMTGMWLRSHSPARFGWMVLANAPARIGLPRAVFDGGIARARSGRFPEMARDMFARWVAPGTQEQRPHWCAEHLGWMVETDGAGFADAFAALRDADLTGDLGKAGPPTLIVTGAADAAFPPAAAGAMAGAMGGRVAVVEAAGHLAPLEQPAAFARIVRDFAASVRAGG